MSDDERRLDAAAKVMLKHFPALDHIEWAIREAIEAYNAPLEPEVPELVTQMAKAVDRAGVGLTGVDFRIDQARAALRIVCKRLVSRPDIGVAVTASALGLSEQYVTELLNE